MLVEWLTGIARYGYLGVDVFFVISGFVIPLSMRAMLYDMRTSGAFLSSRFIRLYPAYFVAGVASVALWYLSTVMPGFRGWAPEFTLRQILGNIFLTCDIQGDPWLISVFWTLAIEAQYYLLIAVSFPFLNSSRRFVRYLAVIVWISLPLYFNTGPTVYTWSALFAVGILVYLKQENKLNWLEFALLEMLAVWVHWGLRGDVSAVLVILAAISIFLPPLKSRPLVWIGFVSYSLYLIHIPFGGRIINLAMRLPAEPYYRVPAVVLGVAVSLVAAAFFYYLIEKPSHVASRNVRKRLLN